MFLSKPASTRKAYEPLRRGEAVMKEAARRSAQQAANASRRSAIERSFSPSEKVAVAVTQAWDNRADIASNAVSSSLRFIDFLRAYIGAFAAGFGVYLLLTDLLSGHFNIFAILATHVFAIIAAPLYAMMLAPAIFGLYSSTRILPLREDMRVYVLGALPGAFMLLPMVSRAGVHDLKTFAFATAVIASGLVAARTFNRTAAKIRAKRDALLAEQGR